MCSLTTCCSHDEKKWPVQFADGMKSRTAGWCVWINVINIRPGPFIFPWSIWAGNTQWTHQMKRYEGLRKCDLHRSHCPLILSLFLFSPSRKKHSALGYFAKCVLIVHKEPSCLQAFVRVIIRTKITNCMKQIECITLSLLINNLLGCWESIS